MVEMSTSADGRSMDIERQIRHASGAPADRLHLRGKSLVVVVVVLALATTAIVVRSATQAAAATAVPSAPTSVSLSVTDGGARASLTWSNPTTGVPATYDAVTLLDVTNPRAWFAYGSSARCYGCTSYSFHGLLAGRTYWAAVAPFGPGGAGPAAGAANTVVADQSPCASRGFEACVSVDLSKAAGPVSHAGAGLLNLGAGVSDTYVAKVAPRWLRYATGTETSPDYSSVRRARSLGASTIENLSDDWTIGHRDPTTGFTAAPWQNSWNDWVTFVKAKVSRSIADNAAPSYWQVWNEAGGNTPLMAPADQAAFTPDRQLELYRRTWQAVKSASSSAKVTWLATVGFHGHADQVDGNPAAGLPGQVALDQFLSYLKANNLTIDLLTWHDSGAGSYLTTDGLASSRIPREVAAARTMLAQAGFGSVSIALDEYASPIDHTSPSASLDQLVGIETSGVVGAMRACWWDQDPTGSTATLYDGCNNGMMDNLLTPVLPGLVSQPRASLWVYDAYRQLAGNRLTTSSTSDFVEALASSSSTSSARVMIGRHWTCLPGKLNPSCPTSWMPSPLPANEQVNVSVPNGIWAINATSILPLWGAVAGPVPKIGVPLTATVTNGHLSITVPAVADGEVVSIALSRIA